MNDMHDAFVPTPDDLKAERITLGASGRDIDRRTFLGKCGRWTGGIILVGCFGSLASCAQKDDSPAELEKSESDYYLKQKDKLLEDAREFSETYELMMTPEYGKKEAKAIAGDMLKR